MKAGRLRRGRAHALRLWEGFWFQQIPPHIYAAARIAIGSVSVATLLVLNDVATFWALDGLVPLDGTLKPWLQQQGLGTLGGVAVYLGCLVAFTAMTVGYRTGVAVLFSFAASLAQLTWNSLPLSSANHVIQVLLFCLIWTDCGAVWSIDAWLARRRRGHRATAPTSAIAPLRLMRFQIALIYLNTGLWKLFDPIWRDGSAVHYVLQENVFHRYQNLLPPSLDWTITVLTYTTLFWELGFAVLILLKPTRVFALLLGLGMHLGMLLTIEVGAFSYVMIASYAVFLPPDQVAIFAYKLRSRLGQAEVESTGASKPADQADIASSQYQQV